MFFLSSFRYYSCLFQIRFSLQKELPTTCKSRYVKASALETKTFEKETIVGCMTFGLLLDFTRSYIACLFKFVQTFVIPILTACEHHEKQGNREMFNDFYETPVLIDCLNELVSRHRRAALFFLCFPQDSSCRSSIQIAFINHVKHIKSI